MATSKESKWKRTFLKYLNMIPDSRWIIVPTSGIFHAGVGTPDVLGCVKGRMVWIEFKVEPNNLSDAQEMEIEKWANSNAMCWAVWISALESEFRTYHFNTYSFVSYPIKEIQTWTSGIPQLLGV